MNEMHSHHWKPVSQKGFWKSSSLEGLFMAYEIRVNRCECGEEKKIKAPPKGIWWRGGERRLKRVQTYPEQWKKALAEAIRRGEGDDRRVPLDRISRYGISAGLTRAESEALTEALVADGMAERFERYPKRSEKDIQIVIPGEILRPLREMLGLTVKEKDEETIDVFFDEWERSKQGNGLIVDILDRLAELWLKERAPILPLPEGTIRLKGLKSFRLLLDTFRAIASLDTSGGTLPFRELSIRITGNSKGLVSIKPYLKRLLGDLDDFGIVDHAPLLFCRLPLTGEVGGRAIDLSAASDYVPLTSSTATAFQPVQGHFRALLLIENQTSFESFLAFLPNEIGVIWLSGYPPGHVRAFVHKLLKWKPVSGWIWCDLDPDGIEIALNVGKWFEQAGQSWHPIGMDESFFFEKETRDLDERDKVKIAALKTRPDARVFREALAMMEKSGKKQEQEAIKKDLLIEKLLKNFP